MSKNDPAGIKGMKDIAKALKAIKDKSATFVWRGDNSGTHLFELMLWTKDVGINRFRPQTLPPRNLRILNV